MRRFAVYKPVGGSIAAAGLGLMSALAAGASGPACPVPPSADQEYARAVTLTEKDGYFYGRVTIDMKDGDAEPWR